MHGLGGINVSIFAVAAWVASDRLLSWAGWTGKGIYPIIEKRNALMMDLIKSEDVHSFINSPRV